MYKRQAKRERRKEEAIEQTHAAGKDGGGEPVPKAKAKSQPVKRWAKELPGDVREDLSAKRDTKKGQLVLLENKSVKWPGLLSHGCGWTVCHKWPTWLTRAFERSPNLGGPEGYKKRSIVLREVHAETIDKSATALCGRLVGGFLTTEQQVIRSPVSYTHLRAQETKANLG